MDGWAPVMIVRNDMCYTITSCPFIVTRILAQSSMKMNKETKKKKKKKNYFPQCFRHLPCLGYRIVSPRRDLIAADKIKP